MSGDRPPLTVTTPAGAVLRGDSCGDGPAIVALHGLTATRRQVLHGSKLLARRGLREVAYDARGHGESDPAPESGGYSYEELAADLGAVVAKVAPERRVILAGHSMGAHTLIAYALEHLDHVAAVVAIGPAASGMRSGPDVLAGWDRLAEGLAGGGVEGFVAAYDDGTLDPGWRETLLRIARQRLELHHHPEAVAQALRAVPRSTPFASLDSLAGLAVPALVVASHDQADPGHPYATAEAWAEALPQSRLVSEDPGESPLAWQGGRLSRTIAEFSAEPAVRERLEVQPRPSPV